MPDQIKNKDIFEPGLMKQVIADSKELLVVLDGLEDQYIDIAKAQQKILQQQDNKTLESITKTRKAAEALNETERRAEKIRRQKLLISDKLSIAQSKEGREIAKAREQLNALNRANRNAVKENKAVVGSYAAVSAKLARLRKEYKNLAVSEGTATKGARNLRKEIIRLDTGLKRIDKSVGQSQRNVGNYGGAFSKLGSSLKGGLGLLGVASGAALVTAAVTKSVKVIGDFDEAVADISKVTGLAKEDARELAQEIIKLDTRTPINELLELASAGGRLGLTGQELIDFTKQTDKAFVALGDSLDGSAEEIGLSLGKIGSTFDIEREFGIGESINKIGSSLNDLGANSKAQEGAIQDFTQRLAGVAKQANLSIPEVQALGALFDESGQSVEVSASTFSKLLPAIGADTKKFAQIAGKDIEEFEKLVSEKPLEALKEVAKGAKNSSGGLIGLSKTLKNYGIDSARAAGIVGILSDKTGRLTELQKIANDAFDAGTSLSDEFAVKNETLSANVEKLTNNFDKLILSFENGEGALSKLFISGIKGLNEIINNIERLGKGFTILTGESSKLEDRWKVVFNGIGELIENTILFPLIKVLEVIDQISGTDLAKELKFPRFELVSTRVDALTVNFKKLSQEQIRNRKVAKGIIQEYVKAGLTVKEAVVEYKKLRIETKKLNEETNEGSNLDIDSGKEKRKLTGLIEKQAKAVSDLSQRIQRAKTEELILELSIKLDVETEELERLKRIVSSSFEEIDKIERELIDDANERRIAQEIEKSEKVIKQIESNSRIEEKVKKRLIAAEQKRLATFVNKEEIKAGKERIKREADLATAEFDQRRTGFKTQQAFEKEREQQAIAIKRNALEAELKLLEQFGDEESKVRQEQIKAQIEALNKLPDAIKAQADLIGAALEAVADLVDEKFEARVESIGEAIDKTDERIGQLREKATEGTLAAEESLAFEKKKEAELEKQRERERKRQEKAQALFTVLSTYQANVNAGVPNPLAKTFADVAVLKGLASTFSSAYDGVDDTGGRGQVDSKGGKLWVLHPNEQVWSKKDRGEVGNRSREEVKSIVKMYDTGTMQDIMKHNGSSDIINSAAFPLNGLVDRAMLGEMKKINGSIQGIEIPEGTLSFDQVRDVLNLVYKKGNKKVKEISRLHG